MTIKEKYLAELERLGIGPADREQREIVREYIHAMERAPDFTLADPADRYKLLAEYGEHVLCARDDGPQNGYTFVTWEYSYGHSGVEMGHYMRDYTAAKQDFAVRAGLVREDRLFTPEQSALLHRAVTFASEGNEALAAKEQESMISLLHKLEDNMPAQPSQTHEPEMEMGGMA